MERYKYQIFPYYDIRQSQCQIYPHFTFTSTPFIGCFDELFMHEYMWLIKSLAEGRSRLIM